MHWMKKVFIVLAGKEPAKLTRALAARSWETPQLGILLSALILLFFVASFTGLLFYEEQIPLAKIIITLLIYSMLIALVAGMNRKQSDRWRLNCGMGRNHAKEILLGPVLYLAIIPFLMLATAGYHFLLEHLFGLEIELQEVAQTMMQELSWVEGLYILTAIFVAPVYEEVMFRGIVFPYLAKRIGPLKGALMVSLLFALMHFHLPSFVPLFLLSAVLCWTYWRTRSLWAGIGLHAVFNTVSILALNFAE